MQSYVHRLGQFCLTPQPILALTIYSGLCLATLASALGHLGSADPLVMGCFAALAGVGLLFSLLWPTTQNGLPTAALLAAQPAATTPLPDTAFASVAAMRDAALGYETGVGMPRSYALAWRLGSLAAAAGDGPSRSLLDRLEARFKGDPAWAATRDGAADQAAQDWTAQGLAARLKGE